MSNRRRHVGTRDDPLPSKCLGVFGLNLDTKESVVTRIFGRFGTLRKVQIVVDAKVSLLGNVGCVGASFCYVTSH